MSPKNKKELIESIQSIAGFLSRIAELILEDGEEVEVQKPSWEIIWPGSEHQDYRISFSFRHKYQRTAMEAGPAFEAPDEEEPIRLRDFQDYACECPSYIYSNHHNGRYCRHISDLLSRNTRRAGTNIFLLSLQAGDASSEAEFGRKPVI